MPAKEEEGKADGTHAGTQRKSWKDKMGGRGSHLGGGTMSPKTFSVFNPLLLWGSPSLLVQRPLKFSQPAVSERKASMRWYHGPHRPLSGGVVPPSVQQRAGRPPSFSRGTVPKSVARGICVSLGRPVSNP